MSARPPLLRRRPGLDDRVSRVVFPGPVDGLRARHDHHVPGGRPGCAADCGDHVVIVTAAHDLRALRCESFDDPVLGVAPRVIHVLDPTDNAQPVGREAYAVSARQEQPAGTVIADGVPRIDVPVQFEVDRVGPGPRDRVGVNDIDRPVIGKSRRDVTIVTTAVLDEFGRPDRPDGLCQRGVDRRPVHEIAAVPDHDAGIGVETRKGQVVVVAIPDNAGVRMITGKYGIQIGPVAQVGFTLALDPRSPAHVCIGIERRRGPRALRHARRGQPRAGQG